MICPEAAVKLFVTASPKIRAERRYLELVARGVTAQRDAILNEVLARDARDQDRATAPLVAAPDATLIDTSDLTAAQAVRQAIAVVDSRRS